MDDERICTLGISGGCWVVLGAAYLRSKNGEAAPKVKAQFHVSPDISCSIDDNYGILQNNFQEKIYPYFLVNQHMDA